MTVIQWEDCDRIVKLSDLGRGGNNMPLSEWTEIRWAECHLCGALLYGPVLQGAEGMWDGDSLICVQLECGLQHQASCDSETELHIQDGEFLRETALLGARRLLKLSRGHWDEKYVCEQAECDRSVWIESDPLDGWWLDMNMPHDVAFCPEHAPDDEQASALARSRDAWRAEFHHSAETDFQHWRAQHPYPVFSGQSETL